MSLTANATSLVLHMGIKSFLATDLRAAGLREHPAYTKERVREIVAREPWRENDMHLVLVLL